jgi:hypothetical protein
VHPRALIANVDKLKEIAVQARCFARVLKERLVGSGCTGSNDHAIQSVGRDSGCNVGQSRVSANEEVVLGKDYVGERAGRLDQSVHIQIA